MNFLNNVFKKYSDEKLISIFRKVSIAEGISCFVLFCMAMPIKRYFETDLFAIIFIIIAGNIHGLFFVLYLIFCIPARKIFKWDDEDFVFALLSSLFPFATIWVEKKLARFDREND